MHHLGLTPGESKSQTASCQLRRESPGRIELPLRRLQLLSAPGDGLIFIERSMGLEPTQFCLEGRGPTIGLRPQSGK